jgi:hypothetical protein
MPTCPLRFTRGQPCRSGYYALRTVPGPWGARLAGPTVGTRRCAAEGLQETCKSEEIRDRVLMHKAAAATRRYLLMTQRCDNAAFDQAPAGP